VILVIVTDHLGRKVEFEYPPKRIISLCPGITETLYFLENELVGRTKYCIFPVEKVKGATVVGGTKEINLQTIRELNPDLIIAEKEENTKEIVESLEGEFPVFVAEVQSIQGAYRMILDMGRITDRERQAELLVQSIQQKFQSLSAIQGKRVAYVIWRKPYMVVGKNTYINSVLEELGFSNPCIELEGRYPAVTEEQLKSMKLDYIFLATEPFPFQEKHKEEFQQFLPNSTPLIVDGEMFWYGAKMLKAAEYLQTLVPGTSK
jgi:iron complex transport system substrate-binding protein